MHTHRADTTSDSQSTGRIAGSLQPAKYYMTWPPPKNSCLCNWCVSDTCLAISENIRKWSGSLRHTREGYVRRAAANRSQIRYDWRRLRRSQTRTDVYRYTHWQMTHTHRRLRQTQHKFTQGLTTQPWAFPENAQWQTQQLTSNCSTWLYLQLSHLRLCFSISIDPSLQIYLN